MKKLIFAAVSILICATSQGQQREKKSNTGRHTSELDQYFKDDEFDYVYKVTSENNVLSIFGYKKKQTTSSSVKVALEQGEVFELWSGKYFKPTVSVLTVPFKTRRAVNDFPMASTSGLTNLGLNFAMPEIKVDRYFSNGNKSSHSLSAGIWLAPSVEELTPLNTLQPVSVNSKELYFSVAASIVYTYNNIQLTFIPIGCDTATNTAGKNWAYNGRIWHGFGIGLIQNIRAASKQIIINKNY